MYRDSSSQLVITFIRGKNTNYLHNDIHEIFVTDSYKCCRTSKKGTLWTIKIQLLLLSIVERSFSIVEVQNDFEAFGEETIIYIHYETLRLVSFVERFTVTLCPYSGEVAIYNETSLIHTSDIQFPHLLQ